MSTGGDLPGSGSDEPGERPAGARPPDAPAVEGSVPHDRAGSGGSTPVRRRRRRRARTVVLGIGAAVVLALVAAVLWVRSEADPSGPSGARVVVALPSGTGVDQLADILARRQVIGSALAFQVWGFVHGTSVRAGTYAFRRNSSFGTVDGILGGGPNVFALEVPPGFTVAELAERVGQLPGHDASHFAHVAASGTVRSPFERAGAPDLEGLLATGTYEVTPGETDVQLLTTMVDRFDTTADRVGLTSGAAALGLTPYQVVTMASVVEKEGVIARNLGPVARVIVNRLAAGMPLQMDSTVLYAEGRDGGTVTPTDLRLQTPYNTYLHTGLTPTPICFPSEAALQAAVDPPPGSWLYFVVVEPDGTEAFADTFPEQQANEALAKARGLP